MTDWIADGEKYALIGLDVKIEQSIPFSELRPGLWAWTDQKFELPKHWREWIGSIRADEVEGCNLALLSKQRSQTADILDHENALLQRRVSAFYTGLLLSSAFTPAHRPIILTGSRRSGEIDVRQQSTFDSPALNLFRFYPPILPKEIERAASLAQHYEQLTAAPPAGGVWRIVRSLSVYLEARTKTDLLDRLHQYCRCIDGLILSERGKGEQQFKSRTQLFIGPREHALMGGLYTIRSNVEHLQEHKYLEIFDRAQRLNLVQKEAIAEHIARNVLAHIIENPRLWAHFGNNASLALFWGLDTAQRQSLWGAASVRVSEALVGYNPGFITDDALGKRP